MDKKVEYNDPYDNIGKLKIREFKLLDLEAGFFHINVEKNSRCLGVHLDKNSGGYQIPVMTFLCPISENLVESLEVRLFKVLGPNRVFDLDPAELHYRGNFQHVIGPVFHIFEEVKLTKEN